MTRPRDSQSSKVWAALNDLTTPKLDMKELQRIADRLTKSAWFKRRLPQGRKAGDKYSVLFIPQHNNACTPRNYTQLGLLQRDAVNLLHQMAHYMLPETVAWHGPEFARLMLELVGHVGLDPSDTTPARRKADREALKEAYTEHGVKWRVFSPEARENARNRWFERDLKSLAAELQEETAP